MSSKLHSAFTRLRRWLADPLRALPLPRAWVEVRCARRLDRLARRVLDLRARIDARAARPDTSDADGNLRRMLAGVGAELGRLRCDLAQWHMHECGGRSGTRLATALARLNKIAAETQAAALRLQRALEDRRGA